MCVVFDGLVVLCDLLFCDVEIWVGGSSWVLCLFGVLVGVRCLDGLVGIVLEVMCWWEFLEFCF